MRGKKSREAWGRLRKLSSGRWQSRYLGPDGREYTARTEDDRALTFQTKTGARAWLAATRESTSDSGCPPRRWPDVAARRRSPKPRERLSSASTPSAG